MSEFIKNNLNTSKSRAVTGALMAGLVILGAGCSTDSVEDARANLAPIDRVAFEYLGQGYDSEDWDGASVWSDDCLNDTPYDFLVNRSGNTNASFELKLQDNEQIAVITPSALFPQSKQLTVTGLSGVEPLKPVDTISERILNSYDCPR